MAEVESKTMQLVHRITALEVAILRRVMPGRCRKQQTGARHRLGMTNWLDRSWQAPAGSRQNATCHGRRTFLPLARQVGE